MDHPALLIRQRQGTQLGLDFSRVGPYSRQKKCFALYFISRNRIRLDLPSPANLLLPFGVCWLPILRRKRKNDRLYLEKSHLNYKGKMITPGTDYFFRPALHKRSGLGNPNPNRNCISNPGSVSKTGPIEIVFSEAAITINRSATARCFRTHSALFRWVYRPSLASRVE